MKLTHSPVAAIAPPINVPQAAPKGAPSPNAANATVLSGSYLNVTPTIPNPAGEATASPKPQMARNTHNPILFCSLAQSKAYLPSP
jgi:hypothetical protein